MPVLFPKHLKVGRPVAERHGWWHDIGFPNRVRLAVGFRQLRVERSCTCVSNGMNRGNRYMNYEYHVLRVELENFEQVSMISSSESA